MLSIYYNFCPNCGKNISDDRLKKSLFCSNCMKEFEEKKEIVYPLWYYNLDKVNLQNSKKYVDFFRKVEEFKDFFYNITGKHIWDLQLTWSRRFFLGYSFSMIAPTGVGKTTWGLVMGLYNFLNNLGKIYFVLPTTLLTVHTFERFEKLLNFYCEKKGICKQDLYKDIVFYHSKLKKKDQKLLKERISNGDFKILFTTTNFLYKNFDLYTGLIGKFKFIFVDDVDSILKSAKNIDYLLKLMGFSDEDINLANELVKLKFLLVNTSSDNLKYQNILNKIEILQNKIQSKREKLNTVLVVSSATAKPKGRKIKLLSELLGFEVGKANTNIRNVLDLYVDKDYKNNEDIFDFYKKDIIKLLKEFKNGILFFIPSDLGKDYVDNLKEKIEKLGYKVETYENLSDETILKFRSGEIQILLGIASYRNPLARGIDLPDIAKYAIFLGVPKFIFSPNIESNPSLILNLILSLNKVLPESIKSNINWDQTVLDYISFLKKISSYKLDYIMQNKQLYKKFQEIKEFLVNLISNKNINEILKNAEDISFDGEKFIIADVAAYIQASGRVSRMYVGGLTKGLSLIFLDNKKAFNNLKKKIKYYFDDVDFKELKI